MVEMSHCYCHDVDEPVGEDCYRVCFECGHVWTAAVLIAAYNAILDECNVDEDMFASEPVPHITDAEQCFACPECVHDF